MNQAFKKISAECYFNMRHKIQCGLCLGALLVCVRTDEDDLSGEGF